MCKLLILAFFSFAFASSVAAQNDKLQEATMLLKNCVLVALSSEKQTEAPSVDGLVETCSNEFQNLLSLFPESVRHETEHFLRDELGRQLRD